MENEKSELRTLITLVVEYNAWPQYINDETPGQST